MVELLMEYGANLNVTDKRNRRPLHYACHRGNIDLVEFLLRNGADTTAKDRDGLRPVAYAAVADHDGVVKAIFDFEIEKFGSPTSLHFTSDRGESLIHLTVANGNINVCESLLSYGADVNLRNSTNLLTPLMVACTSTRASPLALLLLHNGADLKLKSADGRTALHFMAANDVWSLISTMIKYGANVNSKDNRGLTPLHTAALSGHQKCVRKLLDLKAEVNCSSNVGQTALHFAVYEGQEDVIQLLLENNANVQLVDNFDRSVLHYACMGGKITPKTLEQLIYKGADIFGLDNCYRYHSKSSLSVLVSWIF